MPNSYYKPSKTIVPTPHKKGTRKLQINIPGRHRCKILYKILTRQIQQHVKMIIHCDHVELIPRTQGWFNMCKSFHVIHHINKMKNKNHMIKKKKECHNIIKLLQMLTLTLCIMNQSSNNLWSIDETWISTLLYLNLNYVIYFCYNLDNLLRFAFQFFFF